MPLSILNLALILHLYFYGIKVFIQMFDVTPFQLLKIHYRTYLYIGKFFSHKTFIECENVHPYSTILTTLNLKKKFE